MGGHLSCCCILLFCALIYFPTSPHNALAAYAPDLIPELPGQPAPVSFAQYAGYITINATAGRAFFYYFVESETSPHSSPLTLWLNGGPGCSSVGIGAFTELGPFLAKGNGIIRNDYGWNKYSNVLFVESPSGVGFSYSNTSSDYSNRPDDFTTAEDNLVFLLNWMEKFPEYKGRNLYITGESYAGHYVPQLASNVVNHMKAFGTSVLNLKAIAMGNPALDNLLEINAQVTFLWTHGLSSYQTTEAILKYCNWTQVTPSSACNEALNNLVNEVGLQYINPYDVIADICITSTKMQELTLMMTNTKMVLSQTNMGMDVCIIDEVPLYLNRPDVQHVLHANLTNLPYPWGSCSGIINYGGGPDTMTPVLKTLLENGLRILAFSGDQDLVLPFIGTSSAIYRLAKYLALNTTMPYSPWFEGQQVGGWTIGYGGGKLTFATVRGASHQVPTSQPARALQLFKSFIAGTPLPSSPHI